MAKSLIDRDYRLQEVADQLRVCDDHGPNLAGVCVPLLARARKLAAFQGAQYAKVRAALDRWREHKKNAAFWDEVVGTVRLEGENDPHAAHVITFQRVVSALWPDLADFVEDTITIGGKARPHHTGKCESHLWCQWAEAKNRLAELIESIANGPDFTDRLLAGPDDVELTPRQLAQVAAELKRPLSLSAVQSEKRAAGQSETLAKRDKLKRILDFNRGLQATVNQAPTAEPMADADSGATEEATNPTPKAKKPKRSTERGEGRAKLIAALTKHHKYADGGCLNLEPVGNNELARLAVVSDSTASAFFNREFGGHTKYRTYFCSDTGRLVAAIKHLRQEYTPDRLFGGKPPGEDDRDDER